jgi:hypothetical protein
MTSGKPSNVHSIGEHTLEFEPPDVCVVRLGETFTLEDCYAFIELQRRLMAEHGGIFQIGDYTRVRSIAPEVRKFSAEMTAPPEFLGSVLFGVSFHVRVLAKLVITLRTLAKREMNVLSQMVESEAEARAVIDQWRRDLQQKKKKGG